MFFSLQPLYTDHLVGEEKKYCAYKKGTFSITALFEKGRGEGKLLKNYFYFIDLHQITLRSRVVNETHLQITCHADGSPFPSIQWYKDGSLYNDTSIIFVRTNETTDSFVCNVSNSVGSMNRQLKNTGHTCMYNLFEYIHIKWLNVNNFENNL